MSTGLPYKNKYLDAAFSTAHGSMFPATYYVALMSVEPSDSGGGTELSGGGYARASVANTDANWPAASGGAKHNGTVIPFPTATAPWSAPAWAIYDAASAGQLVHHGTFAGGAVTAAIGEELTIDVGGLVLTVAT